LQISICQIAMQTEYQRQRAAGLPVTQMERPPEEQSLEEVVDKAVAKRSKPKSQGYWLRTVSSGACAVPRHDRAGIRN